MSSIEPITPGIAVVTGASSGIGRSAALALNKAGWTVVLVARRREAMEEAVSQLSEEARGRTRVIAADLSSEAEAIGVFVEVKREYGETGRNLPLAPGKRVGTGWWS